MQRGPSASWSCFFLLFSSLSFPFLPFLAFPSLFLSFPFFSLAFLNWLLFSINFLTSSGPGSGEDREREGEARGRGLREGLPLSSHCVWSPDPHLVVQLPTAACPGLHSTASFWARPAPSLEAPSTSAATPATGWWDTAWPFAPGTPRATTCGARPFLSVKVRSRWERGDRWLGSYPQLGLVPGPITSKCGLPHR